MASAPPQNSPPPPSSSSNSPPPLSSPPPSPPSSSSNSPPPLSSPPPSPPSSSSPPPPLQVSGSPPPSGQNSPPPPPTQQLSPPPPPSPKGGNGDNRWPTPPPPPPPKSNHSPPPPRSLSPPSRGSSSNDSPTSDNWIDDHIIPIVVGVVIGISALLLLALLFYLCTHRKKKKRAPNHDYYGDKSHARSRAPVVYYNSSSPHNWGSQRNGELPPPPAHGARPPSPTPPPGVSSSEVSSNFSGPHGPALPPPHPSVALGFTKNTFTYEELAAATGGFCQDNLLGQGGFGYVHKGVLHNGKEIAVKSLKVGSGQGDREFQAEIEIISRVHHRHLVSLVGYCIAGGQRLLVYEFVPNRTLEFHLHGKDPPTMDWPTRLKIAVGSAKGLAYLHEDCHPRIIHRDIKASNILLDNSFEAKVSDFGLAKLSSDTNTHVSTRVMGTFGYLAPEYASSGKLTEKSDVFSFGIMLLELITGRLPVDLTADMDDSLVDWARPLCASALEDGNYDELVDPRLEGNYIPHEMARMVACAGVSIRHSARRRPKMSQIVRALEGDVSVDQLNEGVKPGQSSIFSSASGCSDYDNSTYSADMRKFRKVALDSQDYASSECGQTSEYGVNPSTSSSEEVDKSGIDGRRHGPLGE